MVDTPTVPTRAEVLGFLRGPNALAGRWFGDRIPGMPAFWWRNYLYVFDEPHTAYVLDEPPLPAVVKQIEGIERQPGAADTSDIKERERQHSHAPFSRPGETEALDKAAREFGLDTPMRDEGDAIFYEAPTMEELEQRRLSRTPIDASQREILGGLVERQAVLDVLADYPQAQQAVRSIPHAGG